MKIIEIYHKILRNFLRITFSFYQRLGFHITEDHYYSPIPNTRKLKEELWTKKSQLVGIDINEKNQIKLLNEFVTKFKEEYEKFPREKTSVPHQYYINNGMFESGDGEILYCMIRYFKPKRVIEIGSGYSTYLSAQAILKNKEKNNVGVELVAIEPYPNNILKKGFPGLSKLIINEVQNIDLSEFTKLQENDILFIDSSHSLKIGSDVQYEYLEILPRLNKGVIVHSHDIFLPAEYPKRVILEKPYFWTEQYLLQAFLAFNGNFEVLWAGSYMHLKNSNLLEKAFSSYNRETVWPKSFWMRKIK